jgi:alpha-glucosidase (family GH31 glycosyl hydrolase)
VKRKRWLPFVREARLWTLNRAFSPGVQRLGAAAWTGDIDADWTTFSRTPASLLNWSLAGMPYSACDIGGFNQTPSPEHLARWMEAGVFFLQCHQVCGLADPAA